jgi:hypothetical protein
MSQPEHTRPPFDVEIDGHTYRVESTTTTGRELRELAGIPPAERRDLYIEEPGVTEDKLVSDHDVVTVRQGMSFFSTPRLILAG